jgi:hypothetical protein
LRQKAYTVIDLDEARYALSVAREYKERGDYERCAEVLTQLIECFPPNYRFGPEVARAIGAPDWIIEWDALDAEITLAVNAQLITLIRARDTRAKQAKKAAKLPRSSKYPEAMKRIAHDIADHRPNQSPSSVSVFVLDKIQTIAPTEGWNCLPTPRTIANWIEKHRTK